MSDLKRLGEEAQRELGRFESAPGLIELVAVWPEAVGPVIARNAWPARVGRDGTLFISTSSSAWAFELTQLEADLVKRLASRLGDNVPKKLRFAPGPLPAPAADAGAEQPRERIVASPKARSRAASLAAGIEDEELRESVARAAAASLERAASDRSV
jgi:predicted nucleic acid-binding Zn ribbon protein